MSKEGTEENEKKNEKKLCFSSSFFEASFTSCQHQESEKLWRTKASEVSLPQKKFVATKNREKRILRDFTLSKRRQMLLDVNWIVGFVDGEGCFHVGINKNSNMKNENQVLCEFVVTQHTRNVSVLYAMKKSMQNIGTVRKNRNTFQFRVRKLSELYEVVLPFFEKHSLKTDKNIDFLGFRDAVHLMFRGEHLTPEGFEKIKTIQSRMNRRRLGKP